MYGREKPSAKVHTNLQARIRTFRDARVVLAAIGTDARSFASAYKDPTGRSSPASISSLTTIATGTSEKTMSSLEIAELTGKRHADVMRDIRTMLRDLGQGLSNFAQAYRHPQNGQEFPCFNLPRDLTFTLVTGYSIPLRKKVIDRWMELEEVRKGPAPAPFAVL